MMNDVVGYPVLKIAKNQMLVGLLDELCQTLEVSETDYSKAETSYQSVAEWLGASENPLLQHVHIYPQGSVAFGTATRPIGKSEFDVDLICHLPRLQQGFDPYVVKKVIGDRLREHGTYEGMLIEKKRCWRLEYAHAFHLDITPSVVNPSCQSGGELVPDKELRVWKPTNPRGYISKFEEYSLMNPSWLERAEDHSLKTEAKAEIAPLPEQSLSKPILKRIIQLLKMHRDYMFNGSSHSEYKPISIIITTLAAWSYAQAVKSRSFSDPYDLILEVIKGMPSFINSGISEGRRFYRIENETTTGENFADKWNLDANLPYWFYEWHRCAIDAFESLIEAKGADQVVEAISTRLGAPKDKVIATMDNVMNNINTARELGRLKVSPKVGIVTTPLEGAISIPKNTFFGR